MSFEIPSVYWPIAKIGFSRNRGLRRAFRLLFCKLYRKRFWNPAMNSWVRNKGFDRRRHLGASNVHAAGSALVLAMIAFYLYFAHSAAVSAQLEAERTCYVWIAALAIFELVYNAPAIVLSR